MYIVNVNDNPPEEPTLSVCPQSLINKFVNRHPYKKIPDTHGS